MKRAKSTNQCYYHPHRRSITLEHVKALKRDVGLCPECYFSTIEEPTTKEEQK